MRKVVNPYSIREGNEQMQWRIIRVVVLSIALVFLWSMLAPHPKPYDKTEVQKIEKESTTQDTLTMAIMSFNLRFANEDDGINSWRFRREHVFDIINRYHPVVMGIQEGLHDQLTDLHENLNWPYERYGLPREDDGEHVQIFYDKSVLEKLDAGNFWMSETPDVPGSIDWGAACVRMATWCKFRVRQSQQDMYVFNTQFDHISEESQNKSALLMTKKIDEIAGRDAMIFLMGDFNTYRHTYPYKFLTSDEGFNFEDAWITAGTAIGNVSYTYHGWQGPHKREEFGAQVGANHIDWILYYPKTIRVVQTKVITETRSPNLYPSDHYPIVSTVII